MSETEPENKSTPTPNTPKRSHKKKTTAPVDPPSTAVRKKGERKSRDKAEGWAARKDCGTLLVPKPLIETLKAEAAKKELHLWQLVQQKLKA